MTTLKQRMGQWIIPKLPITRFLFDQIRLELNATRVGLKNRLFRAQRARLREIRAARDLYVNVACGPFALPEFINLDLFPCSEEIVAWDCRWSLPFSNQSAAGIRSEHFVEHLEAREELPAFLSDCFRVLRPGGILRVIVPDAAAYLRAYCRDDVSGFRELAVSEPFPCDLPTRMDVVNHVFHQWHEHRWGYDFESLSRRLMSVGFERAAEQSFGRSLDPVLSSDRNEHAPYSLYVDAVKPRR